MQNVLYLIYLCLDITLNDMNESIRKLLICLLAHQEIVASWGITHILVNKDSVTFRVDGFMYRGSVLIRACGTYYRVSFGTKDSILNTEDEVLVYLDASIEKGSGYMECLIEWLSKF